jgi:hypothetical protein
MRFPSFLEVKLNGFVWKKENILSFEKIKPQTRDGSGEKKTFEVAERLHKNVTTETW